MENSHLSPICGQDLLRRLLAQIDLERNITSSYKKPRKDILEEEKQKQDIAPSVIISIKHNKMANVYTAANITVPAKSYFYLPVRLNKNVRAELTFLYVMLLQYLRDKYNLQALTMKISVDKSTILVINPTANKSKLRKKSSIEYIEDSMEEISLHIEEQKTEPDNIYQYCSKQEIETRLEYTENPFDFSMFDINPALSVDTRNQIARLLYTHRDVFAYDLSDVVLFRSCIHKIHVDKAAAFIAKSPPTTFDILNR